MIKTFRETLTSLQDSNYGNKIITLPLGAVIWYWTKYLILIAGISLIGITFFITNKLPQVPRFITEKFPDGTFEIKDGVLSSSISQPLVMGNNDFVFILDTNASPSALDSYTSGFLLQKDQAVIKSEDGHQNVQSYKQVPNFSTSRQDLADAISKNIVKVWFAIFGILFVLTLIFSTFTWFWKAVSYLIWAAIFYLITNFILKKKLQFIEVFKIVIYASVLPFILSIILSFSPNPLLEILNLGVLSYFGFNWISNITTEEDVVKPAPPVQTQVSAPSKTRKGKKP